MKRGPHSYGLVLFNQHFMWNRFPIVMEQNSSKEVYLNGRLLAYASNFWAMRVTFWSYSHAVRVTFLIVFACVYDLTLYIYIFLNKRRNLAIFLSKLISFKNFFLFSFSRGIKNSNFGKHLVEMWLVIYLTGLHIRKNFHSPSWRTSLSLHLPTPYYTR